MSDVFSCFPIQQLACGERIRRHDHVAAYAALVLEGHYLEAGDGGRHRVEAGDLIVHVPFSAHLDEVGGRPVRIVNLPLGLDEALRLHSARGLDPGALLKLFRCDRPAFAEMVAGAPALPACLEEPSDLLARVLEGPEPVEIRDWAERQEIAPRTLSRHFRQCFGVTAQHYRWRARTCGAWCELMTGRRSLAELAVEWGFADQAHLTRSIVAVTGHTPGWWRGRRCAGR